MRSFVMFVTFCLLCLFQCSTNLFAKTTTKRKTSVQHTHTHQEKSFLLRLNRLEMQGHKLQAIQARIQFIKQAPNSTLAKESCFFLGEDFASLAQTTRAIFWYEQYILGPPVKKRSFQQLFDHFYQRDFQIFSERTSSITSYDVFKKLTALHRASMLLASLQKPRRALLFMYVFMKSHPKQQQLTRVLRSISSRKTQKSRWKKLLLMYVSFIDAVEKIIGFFAKEQPIQKLSISEKKDIWARVVEAKKTMPFHLRAVFEKMQLLQQLSPTLILKKLRQEKELLKSLLLSKVRVFPTEWVQKPKLTTFDFLPWFVQEQFYFERLVPPRIFFILRRKSGLLRPFDQRLPVYSFARQIYLMVQRLDRKNWGNNTSSRLRNIIDWTFFDLRLRSLRKLPKILGFVETPEYTRSKPLLFFSCHSGVCQHNPKSPQKKQFARFRMISQPTNTSPLPVFILHKKKWFLIKK